MITVDWTWKINSWKIDQAEFFAFDKFTALQNRANKSEVKQYYEALYLSYKPRKKCKISQLFKTNCTYSIFRTINRGLFAKPFKKFPKSPSIRPAGSHFWQAPNLQKCERWSGVWMKINRVTLQHNKEFIMFIFYSVVL